MTNYYNILTCKELTGVVDCRLMKGIDLKLMLILWDQLKWLEKASDHELAQRAGLSHATVSSWRSDSPPKSVRLSTLGQIEKKLGYHFSLLENNEWKIEKVQKVTYPQTPEGILSELNMMFSMPGHIAESEVEKYKLLRDKLKQIKPGDVEKLTELIDLVFHNKKN